MLNRDDINEEGTTMIDEMVAESGMKGFSVVYPGDMPSKKLPAEVREYLEWFEMESKKSLEESRCINCKRRYYAPEHLMDVMESRFFDGQGTFWQAMIDNHLFPSCIRCPSCSEYFLHLKNKEECALDGDEWKQHDYTEVESHDHDCMLIVAKRDCDFPRLTRWKLKNNENKKRLFVVEVMTWIEADRIFCKNANEIPHIAGLQ